MLRLEAGHTYTNQQLGPFIYRETLRSGRDVVVRLRDNETLCGRLGGSVEPWVNPLPSKLREMADGFERLSQDPNNHLNFAEPEVTHGSCGTAACHAGWAGVILSPSRDLWYMRAAEKLVGHLCPWWQGSHGICFPHWAQKNAHLWGNDEGLHMFDVDGHKAFGVGREECTLQTIADHYRAVATRIEERFYAV